VFAFDCHCCAPVYRPIETAPRLCVDVSCVLCFLVGSFPRSCPASLACCSPSCWCRWCWSFQGDHQTFLVAVSVLHSLNTLSIDSEFTVSLPRTTVSVAFEDSSEGGAAAVRGAPPPDRGRRRRPRAAKAPERRSLFHCVYSCLYFFLCLSLTLTPRCQSSCFQFHGSFFSSHAYTGPSRWIRPLLCTSCTRSTTAACAGSYLSSMYAFANISARCSVAYLQFSACHLPSLSHHVSVHVPSSLLPG